MARERSTESSAATYRMLSHARRAQRLNTTQTTNVFTIGDKSNQEVLQDTLRSLVLDERGASTTMHTCCNRLMSHEEISKPNRSGCSNHTANIGAHNTTTELSPLFTSSRPNSAQRPHRSYKLLTTKYLLFAAVAATLVGLLCFVSLTESLLLDTQVNSCPLSECMCKWSNGKKSAQCDHRGLRSLPKQLDSDIQVLDMSANQLTQLTPRIFQERRLTNLQRLYLSDCKLVHIADEAFEQLTNLVELDLSQNNLQQVPTKSLELLRYSLRKLSLANNQIHVIDSAAFSPLAHLNNLDLTHTQVTTLHKNAFAGLHELRELKMGENRLTQLPISAMNSLPEGLTIDLYGNAWHCDCELRQSIEWMQRHQIQPLLNPTCASPARHKDMRWQSVKTDDFMCPPVILNKQEEIVVGAGSNVTLACSARGSPPLTFVWFQDEKNLTVHGGSPSGSTGGGAGQASDPPPSTKLLEERRYEIQEELNPPNITTSILYLMNLKLTDTSVFLCWVQNDAGYSIANFSLIVDDSPPVAGYGTASGGAIMGLGRIFGTESVLVVVLVFLLLLALTIICLFVLKQVSKSTSNKSAGGNSKDLKAQHMNGGANGGKLMSADKFASAMNGNKQPNGRMFATSDDDGLSDDNEDDDHSSGSGGGDSISGSQSSCTKKVGHSRVMAVEELDGFIDHLRSGIINMDYHSMSPVIQFNNQKPPASLQQQVVDKRHNNNNQLQMHPDHHQLTQLNHFPSASNASSQAFYSGVQGASNCSNSMATTVSDLSPSSGSASTSFANNTQTVNPMMSAAAAAAHQQQRQYQMATLMRQQQQQQQQQQQLQQPITNCDYPIPAQQQELATTASYTSDYHSGYSEDPMMQHLHMHPHQHQHHNNHHMMPPLYTSDMDMAAAGNPYHYNPAAPATLITASRPSSMNVARQDLVQPTNVVYPDMQDGRYSSQQQQHYQVRESPLPQGTTPFTHIL